MSTISILTPFKNAAPFLRDCIESVLSQSYSSFEWILVNDHSTDQSTYIIEAYPDDRIQLYTNKGKGILAALQTAQQYITGTYVTRMDADDIMPVNKLKALLDILNINSSGTVATGKVKYFSKSEISPGYLKYESWLNQTAEKGLFYQRIYRECVVASPNWLMYTLDFDSFSGYNQLSYPEDYDMVFRFREKGFEIKASSEVTHLWREHPLRTSRNSDTYQQESFFRLKTPHFIDEFKDRRIQLIGAKKKGILIAQILQEYLLDFDWYEQEETLIGQHIKNIPIKDIQMLKKEEACILSIYPEDEYRRELEEFMREREYYIGANAHYF